LKCLHLLLGEARGKLVVAIAQDALCLLIVVALLIGTTSVISKAAQLFGNFVHILPYINYAHEGIVSLSILALIVRSVIEIWHFVIGRHQ
jgi:hypothetical protein